MDDVKYRDFVIRKGVRDFYIDPDTGERWSEPDFFLFHKKDYLMGVSQALAFFGFWGVFILGIGGKSFFDEVILYYGLGLSGLAIIQVILVYMFTYWYCRESGFNNVEACKRYIDDLLDGGSENV